MHKISVIVPVYNTKPYLRRLVNSILTQSFADFELILVDDGSTDGSGVICDEYAAQDERVRVLHKENGGPNSAVMAGVAATDCEYTVFGDSDDMLAEGALEFLYKEIVTGDLDAVRTGLAFLNADGKITMESVADTRVYCKKEIMDEIISPFFEDGESYPIFGNSERHSTIWGNSRCGKIYKTSLVKTVAAAMDPTISIGEDLIFNLEYLFHCNLIKVVHDYYGYVYCIRADSISRNKNCAKIERYQAMLGAFSKIAAEHNLPGKALPGYVNAYITSYMMQVIISDLPLKSKITNVKAAYPILTDTSGFKNLSSRKNPCKMLGAFLLEHGAVTPGVIIACATSTLKRRILCINRKGV